VNGYLAGSGDINALENNIRVLLGDPLKAKKMGTAGRALVESHTAQYSADLHEQFYHGLILQTSTQLTKARTVHRRKFSRGWTKS
jgi:hypothetical protein